MEQLHLKKKFLFCYWVLQAFCIIRCAPCQLLLEGCVQNMTVNWWSLPPYTFPIDPDRNKTGILHVIIEGIMKECCGSCVEFEYMTPAENSEEMKIGKDGAVLNFPVYGQLTKTKHGGRSYYPVIESPGILHVKPTPTPGSSQLFLIKSVAKCYPIIILGLLMAAVFGALVWMTDSNRNPVEFPSDFYNGFWQGIWWALVSMTTVGYGDKAPRSYVARIIAFVWVLIGLVIIALFNGIITATLTANSLSHEESIFGKNLTAFNKSIEAQYGVAGNARIIPVKDIRDFVRKITHPKKGEIQATGGLIDSYVAGYEEEFLSTKNGFWINKIYEHVFTYGFVTSNELENSTQVAWCIRRVLSLQERDTLNLISETLETLVSPSRDEIDKSSKNVFDSSSQLFTETWHNCLIIIGIMLCCGAAFHVIRKTKSQANDPYGFKEMQIESYLSFQEMILGQIMELENMMVSEVLNFLKVYKRRKEDLKSLMDDGHFKQNLSCLMGDEQAHFLKYNNKT